MFDTVEIKEVKQHIGQVVKSMRKQRQWTQAAMADSLGVSRLTIQNLESGKNFTIDTLLKALKAFDLLDEVDQQIVSVQNNVSSTSSLY